eukprot:760499-Hanusia_phi.AAC.6
MPRRVGGTFKWVGVRGEGSNHQEFNRTVQYLIKLCDEASYKTPVGRRSFSFTSRGAREDTPPPPHVRAPVPSSCPCPSPSQSPLFLVVPD